MLATVNGLKQTRIILDKYNFHEVYANESFQSFHEIWMQNCNLI